jgi:hypothetical protein
MSDTSFGPLNDTTMAMKQTIDELMGLWTQVANKIDLSQEGGKVLLFDADGNRLGAADVGAIEDSLKLCRQSIGFLNGTIKTAKWGNLFEAAQTNSDALAFWSDYAQQTGDTLSQALGTGKYNVAKFFANAGVAVKEDVEASADAANDSIPWIAVGLVAIALIVIFK